MWHFNGEDDATCYGRKGPDSTTALVKILSDLYKGEEQEFIHIKPRDMFSMYNPPSWVSCYPLLNSIHSPVLYHKYLLRPSITGMAKIYQGDPQAGSQPEDHNQALDPRFEEDLDIFMELVEGVFYQASCDGTEVAIIADYPGLLPVSHVSKQETQ